MKDLKKTLMKRFIATAVLVIIIAYLDFVNGPTANVIISTILMFASAIMGITLEQYATYEKPKVVEKTKKPKKRSRKKKK